MAWIDFKRVKALVTLEMVLNRYGLFDNLKKSGANLVGVCPIHSGTNPKQFSVNLEKSIWHCFGDCQAGGNVLDLVANLENCSIFQAGQLLTEWFLSDLEDVENPLPEKAAAPAKENQEQAEGVEEAGENPPLSFKLKNLSPDHPWLKERGIARETADYFGLGFCSRGLLKNRLAIPIINSAGELVAYAGRAVREEDLKEEKYKLPPGFKKLLEVYNLNRQSANLDRLILVESFISVWWLHQAGFPYTVALMGSEFGQRQEELILNRLDSTARILLMFDADKSGAKCASDALSRLGRWVFVKSLDLSAVGNKPHRIPPEILSDIILFD
jgi:DNA primase